MAVKESSHKLKVYLVGGTDGDEDGDGYLKNMNVFAISKNRIFWILHYLYATGIHYLPGYSLIQEIIEIFE